jgi:hypothetical protein
MVQLYVQESTGSHTEYTIVPEDDDVTAGGAARSCGPTVASSSRHVPVLDEW